MKQSIRKYLLILSVLCAALICVAVLSACGGKHEHAFGEYEVTEPATCEADGIETRSCTVCGFKETKSVPAAHKWSEYTVTPAKCEEDGARKRSCAACGKDEVEVIPASGHKWSAYEETTPAKCGVAGEETRSCSQCDEKEHQKIPALQHQWSAFTVKIPATCEGEGVEARTCALCGDEEKKIIPENGHKWTGINIIKEATCEEDGLQSVVCENCKTTKEQFPIPALGHTKSNSIPVTAPGCETEGANWATCGVCDKGYRETVPPTGHNYSDEFTVDKTPTIDEEGQQSRHCVNDKCTSRIDIQPIPRLIKEAYFRIEVVRGEDQILYPTTYNPRVYIKNEAGVTVANGFAFGNAEKRHYFQALLPFGTYTVTVDEGYPAGFWYDPVTISEANGTYPYDTEERYPFAKIHLYSSLGEGELGSGTKKHTVLNDFSFRTIDGDTIRLSDLLKEKKLVWLNFYFNACGPCQSEASEIVRIAQKYDVAVVCFNGRDDVDAIRSGASSIFRFPESFYLVEDRYTGFGAKFGLYGYPLNVFIDSGGFVFESVSGSNYSSQFDSFIRNNIFTTPERESASLLYAEMPRILPAKRRNLGEVVS